MIQKRINAIEAIIISNCRQTRQSSRLRDPPSSRARAPHHSHCGDTTRTIVCAPQPSVKHANISRPCRTGPDEGKKVRSREDRESRRLQSLSIRRSLAAIKSKPSRQKSLLRIFSEGQSVNHFVGDMIRTRPLSTRYIASPVSPF